MYCRCTPRVCLWLAFSLCGVFDGTDALNCNKVRFLTFMAYAFYSLLGMRIFLRLVMYLAKFSVRKVVRTCPRKERVDRCPRSTNGGHHCSGNGDQGVRG